MADIFTENLAGASGPFNDLVRRFIGIREVMEAGLESDPSTLASTLGGDFTSLTSALRSIMPSIPSVPNINLQSGLTSLSGLVEGSARHKALLNDITSNFKTELSAAGFDLDTLVTTAREAVDLEKTLSGIVPNFVKAADGLTAPFQIAAAVKQATSNSVADLTSIVCQMSCCNMFS